MAHPAKDPDVTINPAGPAELPPEIKLPPDAPAPAEAEAPPDTAIDLSAEAEAPPDTAIDLSAEAEAPPDTGVDLPAEAPAPEPEPPPVPERERIQDVPVGIEARIDLYQSHAFMRVDALLQSFNEGFTHVDFDRIDGSDILSDEYDNGRFHVTYCFHENGRDELRVRWGSNAGARKRNDNELIALARQLAHLLGGGTNLRLIDERSGGKNRGSHKG